MAIKRYIANSDTSITNAFKDNMTDRATSANMGAADILETFVIYGQASSTSAELQRILINFPISDMISDRTSGAIPASGSVNFVLKLYNTPHSQTTPENYDLWVSAVSNAWDEGVGQDMELYQDSGSASWFNGSIDSTAATATLVLQGGANLASLDAQTFVLTDTAQTQQTFTFDFDGTSLASGAIGFDGDSNTTDAINSIKTAINNVTTLNITAGTISAAGDSDSAMTLTLTQDAQGYGGNTSIDVSGVTHLTSTGFSGGEGAWESSGGDYYNDASSSFTASFDHGREDISLDITTLVEQWMNSGGNVLGSKNKYGVGIKFTPTTEAAVSSSYTKKFFSRSTEHYFRKPIIEAQWDSATKDDRGRFYASSSLMSATDNLNTLYLYNYVRGQLKNIPVVETGNIYLRIYASSSGSSLIATTPNDPVTGSHVSTGIYKATVALNTTASTVYDRWFSSGLSTCYHTGTIKVKQTYAGNINPTKDYVVSPLSLKSIYRTTETARIRFFIREKDWNPTVYTKTVSTMPSEVLDSGSYKIVRIADGTEAIDYGTGTVAYTQMSHDVSGNYFDMDMGLLEPGYSYGVRVSYYNGAIGDWVEYPKTYKFRVEE